MAFQKDIYREMLTVSGRGGRGAWHGGCCLIIWMIVIILSMSYMTSCVHIHSKSYMASFDSQNLSQNLRIHYVHKGQNLHIIHYVQRAFLSWIVFFHRASPSRPRMPFTLFKFPTLFGRWDSTQISVSRLSPCNDQKERLKFKEIDFILLQEIFLVQAARQSSEINNMI